MTLYVFLNWFFCSITALILILVVVRYRFLLIKPSIVVFACFHIQIQWAAAFQADYIQQYLPRPYAFLMLAQVFPLLGLAVSFFFLHRRTLKVYQRISRPGFKGLEIKPRSLWLLFSGVTAIILIYLAFVPLSSTGIYAILMDPLRAGAARETSLKLLDNALMRYGFAFLKAAVAPLLCVSAMVFMVKSIKQWKPLRSAAAAGMIIFTLIAVSLPGARTPAAMLIVTMIFALFVIYDMPLKLFYILPAFFMIISLPVIFTIFREGQGFDLFIFFDYLQGGIFDRVVVVPMETGLWHVHYAQETGFLGSAGIPKLAEFFAVEPVILGNIIYLKYSPYRMVSGLSNTCFVFAYYSCFGIGTIILSWLGTWLLDLAVIVMDRLQNNAVLLAASASIVTSCFWFVSTMFTTALITDGFIMILITALLLDKLTRFSIFSSRKKFAQE